VKKMVIQCGDLLNVRTSWDETAIEVAAHMGNEQLAAYFGDQGAPVSICTAAMLGQTNLVKSLLKESSDRLRERGAHSEVVETLLLAGIDANHTT
jgi:hypothetical protein